MYGTENLFISFKYRRTIHPTIRNMKRNFSLKNEFFLLSNKFYFFKISFLFIKNSVEVCREMKRKKREVWSQKNNKKILSVRRGRKSFYVMTIKLLFSTLMHVNTFYISLHFVICQERI